MHGSASPSEVFHRNLIDAVYNVEGNVYEGEIHEGVHSLTKRGNRFG